ncbi:MAG: NAD(P)/FAD-dependent oxidoreductase [Candidatus Baldrarchaeia archaeon]
MKFYDVIIVGAGPAGLFAANELSSKSDMKILVIDWGPDVKERICPALNVSFCKKCNPCKIICGVGGAGTLSSGLLNLHPQVGGDLEELTGSERVAWELVNEVDSIFVKYGAPNTVYGGDQGAIEELSRRAAAAGIKFIPIRQRHIGSDLAPRVIQNFKNDLERKGVRFLLKHRVEKFDKGKVVLDDGTVLEAKYLIIAPGRSGARWLLEQARRLGIASRPGPIDVGVRVEVPAIVMEPVIKVAFDPKFHIYTETYDDFVRTFCVNYRGFVVQEVYGKDAVGVNGHTLQAEKSENANFALLVRIELTEPLEDTTAYGFSIMRQTTTLGGGRPLIQRLGDLKRGRRSTWARIERSIVKPTLRHVTPGDIAMALPHRIVTDILEGLEKLDSVIPGVASSSTLLYAPEVKFYANRIEVDKNLETSIGGIFVAGDGAGLSRGLVTAAATGILAARGILRKEGLIS